jgi:hypothetical protein
LAILALMSEAALASSGAHHGTLTIQPRPNAAASDEIDAGQKYKETITTSCYDADGNPLADTVTLTVSGAPDTGGATATFNPNPQQTFSAGATFLVTTTKNTDAKVYSMVLTGTGPVCGQYGTLTLPLTVYPVLSLSRIDLVTVEATGKPENGGSFTYQSATAGGTTIAPIAMSSGVTATTNPNDTTLSDPANPAGSGAPSPGAQRQGEPVQGAGLRHVVLLHGAGIRLGRAARPLQEGQAPRHRLQWHRDGSERPDGHLLQQLHRRGQASRLGPAQ